ncbi:glycosyltransferase involved in cell wall biosynthesis [Rhodanobacter sp. ANJX3]|uniref:glycosyltransferase family 4 protein n=1 Tax=Rhodanobacter sp. ANJX3 TaxID=2723083 RepID=UPI00160B5DFF|nr:glycosyltransferase family 4 protein [Rhodanobacter sp. ANJX3]MBB5360817.1 glycosyltransferase involved in cell wall biosynthesis [Rhodanobacter sp. ANJX3]
MAPVRRLLPFSFKHSMRQALERSAVDALQFRRTGEWLKRSALAQAPTLSDSFNKWRYDSSAGINLYGYFSRWLGLGECARLYANAMLVSGYPVAIHDVDIDIPHERNDNTLAPHLGGAVRFTHDLIFVNPDHWKDTQISIGRDATSRQHVIGFWFWELENFPEGWLHALDDVDEVMVSSAFVEQSIRRICNKPVTRVPLPVVPGEDSGLQRSHFGLDEDSYIYFCAFDFNSTIARKNPRAVIEAFCLAFPRGDEKVTLLIKSSNGHRHAPQLIQLLAAASVDRRIIIRDDMLERAHLQALHRCVDVYVSLHRSEGFGLGIAEAMCMGKPVVATAYSGNMEFMTPANSCLVNYRMIPVGASDYPHAKGQQWADPDPGHAAHHFRSLHYDRALAKRLGAQASIDIARDFSIAACMRVLSERLRFVGASRDVII